MNYSWHDVLGTMGVGFIVGSYFLLQIGRLDSQELRYSLLNALGAGLILVSLLNAFNASAVLVEVFWLAISIFGIVRAIGRKLR